MPNVTPATAGEAATSTAPRTIVARIIARPSLVTCGRVKNGRFRNPLPAAGNGRAGRQRAPSKRNIIAARAGLAARRATGSAPQGEGARPADEIEELGPGGALDAAARDGAAERAQDPAQLAVQCGTLTGDA